MQEVVRHKRKQNRVKSLQNDYFYETDSQMKTLKRQKIGFRRRMIVFGFIAAVILAFFITTYINQSKTLAEKQKLKKEAEQELQLAKDRQEMLNLQIEKLNDDEYIAKLARKEYFLSDEGEIIFTIPEEDEEEK